MGDYTRFEFNVKLRDDAPQEVVDVLKFMADEDAADEEVEEEVEDAPNPLRPDHALFESERWSVMFSCISSSHPDTLPENGNTAPILTHDDAGLRMTVLSSFKNYGGEIRLFCDWISPYLAEEDGKELGSVQFESDSPMSLIKDRGVIVFIEIEKEKESYDGFPRFGSDRP